MNVPHEESDAGDLILLPYERQRMEQCAQILFERVSMHLREAVAHLLEIQASCVMDGATGQEECVLQVEAVCEDHERRRLEYFFRLQIGSVSREGGEGYFSECVWEDEELHPQLDIDVVDHPTDDPRQKYLFTR